MISVEEALGMLVSETKLLPTERLGFPAANLRFTAEDVRAPNDHPLFDQSAVDGYAFAWSTSSDRFEVVGNIPAGNTYTQALIAGQCVRIFTGGMMPAGADTVVMQEHCTQVGAQLTHTDERLRKGANVRLRGEQVEAGQIVLEKGTRLSPQAVGLLRSVGVERTSVHKLPTVAVVVTGSEFLADASPMPGRIFSSNGEMLVAALQQEGIPCSVYYAADELDALTQTLRKALADHDLVITTGGVSVGEHDLVKPALERAGARVIFHKVAQKPGKPMLLSRTTDSLVVGLPGNPRAVMVLFWMYVIPAIRAMQGARNPHLRNEFLPLDQDLAVNGTRAEFRAAGLADGRVELLQDQGSHMLASLVTADALAYVPRDKPTFRKGDLIRVYHLPQ